MSLHIAITGDIRNPHVRAAIAPYLKTGVVWENKAFSDYQVSVDETGTLYLGPVAFAKLLEDFPEAPIVRKSDFN